MMSQLGKQTIAINTLPNISRSKGYQTLKFDQVTGIYSNSFTNVPFWTKIEFSSFFKMQMGVSRWIYGGALLGNHLVEPLKNVWSFYIKRTNE